MIEGRHSACDQIAPLIMKVGDILSLGLTMYRGSVVQKNSERYVYKAKTAKATGMRIKPENKHHNAANCTSKKPG